MLEYEKRNRVTIYLNLVTIKKIVRSYKMNYELTGTVKLINELQTFASGFTKRELIVTVPDGNYPQDISLDFLKDKVELLNDVAVGDEITVSFNLRGREYNGKYFNNLNAWKIQKQTVKSYEPSQASSVHKATKIQEPDFGDDDPRDVPF